MEFEDGSMLKNASGGGDVNMLCKFWMFGDLSYFNFNFIGKTGGRIL